MIHPDIRLQVEPLITAEYVFPEDILDQLRQDETVWTNYQSFSESYRRIRVSHIDSARDRPEEFEKRLNNFIAKTRAGKMIGGYGGIDKYYRDRRRHTNLRLVQLC
jgi:uncharacterized protein YdeI (YjbR/CyaY-like superfamily)